MTKYNNPLPEFRDEDGRLVPVDFVDIFCEEAECYPDDEWYDKIYSLIGRFVVQFNSLEDIIENSILGIMNARAEDARVWVFLERMSTRQKFDALFRLYEVGLSVSDVLTTNPVRLRATQLKHEFDKINAQRNLYVHANWLNIATDETRDFFVEHKTKRTQDGYYGRIRRNITIADINADIETVRVLANDLCDLNHQISHLTNMDRHHINIVQGDVYSGDSAIVWSRNSNWIDWWRNSDCPDLSSADLLLSTDEPFESTLTYDLEGDQICLVMSKEESAARSSGFYSYDIRANINGKVETIECGQMVVWTPEKAPRDRVFFRRAGS